MNRSPVLRRAACALFVLLTGGTATAEPDPDLIAYEPFDYSPEKRVLESPFFAGGQGWQAESWNWTMTKDYRYAVPEGLTYPRLQTAGGAAQQEGENLVQHVRYFLVKPRCVISAICFVWMRRGKAISPAAS